MSPAVTTPEGDISNLCAPPPSNLKMYFMWKHLMHLVLFNSK